MLNFDNPFLSPQLKSLIDSFSQIVEVSKEPAATIKYYEDIVDSGYVVPHGYIHVTNNTEDISLMGESFKLYLNKNFDELAKNTITNISKINPKLTSPFLEANQLLSRKMYHSALICYFAILDGIIYSTSKSKGIKDTAFRILDSTPGNSSINAQIRTSRLMIKSVYAHGDKFTKNDSKVIPNRNYFMHGMSKYAATETHCMLIFSLIINFSEYYKWFLSPSE